jgi:RNA polymerase sigma-70 factor (ECF subfamily)
MLEDKTLIRNFNRGDPDALRRVYEKYKDDLLRLAIALLNDTAAAEDAVNDTFVRFAQTRGEFRLRGSLKSYLTTCIANHARNMYRARQRQKTVDIDQASQVVSGTNAPDEAAIRSEDYQRLTGAMAGLPYEQREIVILHLHGGMRFRQIAESQNISVNTAKSRYRYGLDKLRALLNSEVSK